MWVSIYRPWEVVCTYGDAALMGPNGRSGNPLHQHPWPGALHVCACVFHRGRLYIPLMHNEHI
jgi:hypothetical protein